MLPAILGALLPSVPSIAKMIGLSDNVAKVAGVATDILRKVTGVEETNVAMAALQADPQLMLQFQLAMLQQEQEFERLYVSDKADARYRDIELLRLGKRNLRADWMVGASFALLVLILGGLFFTEPNEYAKGAITVLLGFLTVNLGNVFSFEFGTTRKEDETNKSIIADYIKSPPTK